MSDLAAERDRLHVLLQKQKKQQLKHKRHKKGSLRRHQAKLALARLRGLIARAANAVRKAEGQGAAAAVRWALARQGTTEHPSGSNWGHPVQDWIIRTGYNGPEPWCGCFAHEAVVVHGHAKIATGVHLGYGPAIMEDAAAGKNGLQEVPYGAARAGDILVFWGGEHIGVCRGRPGPATIPTVEGNTSPVSSGSQYNGGCVAAKTRSRSDVSCVARPAYP